MSRRGFFVVLEGPEGSGKSTAARPTGRAHAGPVGSIRLWCASRAVPGPRRSPGRHCSIPDHPVGPVAELFFYLAARADLVQTVIQPALAAGRVVLSDRFALSTEAYQMAGRGSIPPWCGQPTRRQPTRSPARPDADPGSDPRAGSGSADRRGKRQDRLDRESADFHRRVVEYYLAVKGSGVRHLDGRLPPDQLLQVAWTEIRNAAPATFRSAVG